MQDLPQPFTADAHRPTRTTAKVVSQLTQAPPGGRLAQLLQPGPGCRDDDLDVLVTDQARTASRKPTVQRRQPLALNT